MAGVVDGPYNVCEFMSFSRKGNGPDFVEPLGLQSQWLFSFD